MTSLVAYYACHCSFPPRRQALGHVAVHACMSRDVFTCRPSLTKTLPSAIRMHCLLLFVRIAARLGPRMRLPVAAAQQTCEARGNKAMRVDMRWPHQSKDCICDNALSAQMLSATWIPSK